jgi:uncharacterized protein
MRVIITGGTGLIGKALAAELAGSGHEVIVLSRNPQNSGSLPQSVRAVRWDGKTAEGWGELVNGESAIVNLAGENLAGRSLLTLRWTKERKERLVRSRLDAGEAVVRAVSSAAQKPKVVVQASGVGYYGWRGNEPLSESADPGDDFFARICLDWEAATLPVEALGVRRVIVRQGVVLDKERGSLPLQALPFKLFVGGPVGNGKQGYSWIHRVDAAGALRFVIENPLARGAFNVTAPELLTNAAFGKALARALHRPYYLPAPAFAMRLAFGEVSMVLLEGQMPFPQRLLDLGYSFRFPRVVDALRDIYG